MSTDFARSQGSSNYADLPPIPKLILSRDGTVVETHTEIWQDVHMILSV